MNHTHIAVPTDMTHDEFPVSFPDRALTMLREHSAAVCFGCGAMIGFAAGMLTAPARGSDTRRRLARAARRGRDRVETAVETAVERARDARTRVEHTMEDARAAVEHTMEDAKAAFSHARSSARGR